MQYRTEIEGLRALATIPVILFHPGFPLFIGGFSVVEFYNRRARRILPALFFALLISVRFAWLPVLNALVSTTAVSCLIVCATWDKSI